jgi:integrase
LPAVQHILKEARSTRLYALYVLAATLGLRRGELLGLGWSDIDLDEATLTVQQTVQRVGGRLLVEEPRPRHRTPRSRFRRSLAGC